MRHEAAVGLILFLVAVAACSHPNRVQNGCRSVALAAVSRLALRSGEFFRLCYHGEKIVECVRNIIYVTFLFIRIFIDLNQNV